MYNIDIFFPCKYTFLLLLIPYITATFNSLTSAIRVFTFLLIQLDFSLLIRSVQYRYIMSATKWFRILSLGGIDKMCNHLVANLKESNKHEISVWVKIDSVFVVWRPNSQLHTPIEGCLHHWNNYINLKGKISYYLRKLWYVNVTYVTYYRLVCGFCQYHLMTNSAIT